ncbi:MULTISPECIES: hypothetical protein [Halobacterium]|uniref:hypothetical protein n=1 Tax=Halobacterium TaxID=2239 RepID=UPI00073F5B41|nr:MULTISPECIES: hypothetical protein [Halobacterium]MCG1003465.1 hypothetical protein [Halobacterium noricense]
MVSSRTATAAVGVLASVAVSVAAWVFFDVAVFFLAVPLIPLLFRRRTEESEPTVYECPECAFSTRDPEFAYCPRDGARLEEQ